MSEIFRLNIPVYKNELREIYKKCTLKVVAYGDTPEHNAGAVNSFVTNKDDQEWVLTNLLDKCDIRHDVTNGYYPEEFGYPKEFNSFSCCFLTITNDITFSAHSDPNPAKINFLINDSTTAPFRYVKTGETYFYDWPALLNVGKMHIVDNVESLKEPRTTFQIVLNNTIDFYIEKFTNANLLIDRD
jgi:hypothetical protein